MHRQPNVCRDERRPPLDARAQSGDGCCTRRWRAPRCRRRRSKVRVLSVEAGRVDAVKTHADARILLALRQRQAAARQRSTAFHGAVHADHSGPHPLQLVNKRPRRCSSSRCQRPFPERLPSHEKLFRCLPAAATAHPRLHRLRRRAAAGQRAAEIAATAGWPARTPTMARRASRRLAPSGDRADRPRPPGTVVMPGHDSADLQSL